VDREAVIQAGSIYVLVRGSRVRHLRPDQDSGEGYIRAVTRGKHAQLGAEILPHPGIVEPCINVTTNEGSDLFTLYLPSHATFVYGGKHGGCRDAYLGAEIPAYLAPAVVNNLLDRQLVKRR